VALGSGALGYQNRWKVKIPADPLEDKLEQLKIRLPA
jgi:hypothetical protein